MTNKIKSDENISSDSDLDSAVEQMFTDYLNDENLIAFTSLDAEEIQEYEIK